jgi:glutaredoxin
MTRIKNRWWLIVLLCLIASIVGLNLISTPVQADTIPTRTPRYCHICEYDVVYPTPSQTQTPVTHEVAGDVGDGVVNAVLFWMQGCPDCETILKVTLPPLEEKFDNALSIEKVELASIQDVDQLYLLGARLGIPKEDIEVPFLLLGNHYLIGKDAIERQLANLITEYLARGGAERTPVPEFNQSLSGAQSAQGTPVPGEPCSSCDVFDMDDLSPTLTSIAQRMTQTETQGSGDTDQPAVTIYLFWGDGCPHCAAAKPFLERLDRSSDQIVLKSYEVWYVEENQTLFTQMANAHGFEPHYVPTIFIGNRYWEGYSDQIESEIQATVNACLKKGCVDAGAGVIPGAGAAAPTAANSTESESSGETKSINLPLLGTIDLSSQSLLVSTLLISFVDGFNPCSVWVLTMLLALTLHTGSRKKVLFIGIIFLTVTAAIYGLFIAGLFSMFKVVSMVGWIQIVVSLVALIFALVNIKDYFWYKEGVSFTIADDKKPGIFQRIRKLMDASQSIWGLAGGTVVLAAGVSLVEFSCTAGFPVIWSNLLVSQNVSILTFILLLLVYMVIYQLDELGIFLAAVFSMRASRLEEKHGRILKLIGGMLMLSLAGVMLINPNIMNNLTSSLIVFGITFAATLVVLLVHRLILPRLGIQIGSEFKRKPSARQLHSKSRRRRRVESKGTTDEPNI